VIDQSIMPMTRKIRDTFVILACQAPIVQESGTQLSHEEVVSQLHADTLSSSSMLGHRGRTFTCGDFAQAIFLNFKSEVGASLSSGALR